MVLLLPTGALLAQGYRKDGISLVQSFSLKLSVAGPPWTVLVEVVSIMRSQEVSNATPPSQTLDFESDPVISINFESDLLDLSNLSGFCLRIVRNPRKTIFWCQKYIIFTKRHPGTRLERSRR